MPYALSTKKIKGKKKWCMTNKNTGKTYCYKSKTVREKGMKMHEAFSHNWKPTGKAKVNKSIKKKVKKASAFKR
jgi:hypothetical protein